MKHRLTGQQEALVQGNSPPQAYRRAYKVDGMKDETVARRARLLLQDEKIQAWYQQLSRVQADRERRREVASAGDVLEELSTIGLGLEAGDGEGDERSRAPGVRERLKALELLGKHYRLFSEQGKKADETEVRIFDDLHRD